METFYLPELLKHNPRTQEAFQAALTQGQAYLDCRGVACLTSSQLVTLDHLFPATWDVADFWALIDSDTLSPALADQLLLWIRQRRGAAAKNPSPPPTMAKPCLDIFQLRDAIVQDYRDYTTSFVYVRDPALAEFIEAQFNQGALWPEPLVQLSPTYQLGASLQHLIDEGVLHRGCRDYFPTYLQQRRFYYHQERAFRAARRQEPYVLTTGTGSGKSLTYVVPILDDLLRHPGPGVRAILVYPTNALINSQEEEFNKYLQHSSNSQIRVERYTGQESLQEKTRIQANPPQILLTNYMMLELMLSRNLERSLVESPSLKFVVLDELHTYRGRQGADVALLMRKLRRGHSQELLYIGTSATMATGGDQAERRQTVARVASKLFGVTIDPDNVIDETLQRTIPGPDPTADQLRQALAEGLSAERTKASFCDHPLAAWIEMNFGLEEKDGHLTRRTPISLAQGACRLASETGLDPEVCRQALRSLFLWGSSTGSLPFRLHQFIAKGGNVYATAEPRESRFLTLEGQYSTTDDRLLYPVLCCRECGQDYYAVRYDPQRNQILPRPLSALNGTLEDQDSQAGYFTLNEPGLEEELDLPQNWFKETKRRGKVPKPEYQSSIPRALEVLPTGQIAPEGSGVRGWFVSAPLAMCLNCGILHPQKGRELNRLASLGSGGRSTATTLLCVTAVEQLRRSRAVDPEACKILSFTDNRQDASLQAGHFNDFVQTSLLRRALNRAVQTQDQLTYRDLVPAVVRELNIPQQEYARQETRNDDRKNQQAWECLIEYRLYQDLRRGWQITLPNLEQCGLLEIGYDGLEAVCGEATLWPTDSLLRRATPEERHRACRVFLDRLRRELVLDAYHLQQAQLESLKRQVQQLIREPWGFDDSEYLQAARWATWVGGPGNATVKLTARSKIGKLLCAPTTWPSQNLSGALVEPEYQELLEGLVYTLVEAGFLLIQDQQVQVRVSSLVWQARKWASLPPDPLSSGREDKPQTRPVNQFFQQFYNQDSELEGQVGGEHTSQVNNEVRQARETDFRKGKLSALFCSPTMELGIDIADLSVVHLRNLPPNPANYAQRSGRAGRSGQGALILTYASAESGHDQYFFRRPEQMVAGAVLPPCLELGNQDLIKAHIHSLWLAYTGCYLDDSMNKVLDLEQDEYPLKASLREQLTLKPEAVHRCFQAAEALLADQFCQADLAKISWYTGEFLGRVLEQAQHSLDRACDRWRRLYHQADTQLQEARRAGDRCRRGAGTQRQQEEARTLQAEAERQINVLVGQSKRSSQSQFDFQPYRYLASEGFLPGYNFPRLPVRAYIPNQTGGEFITRARPLAIQEFGPRNILYYEGRKFQVSKTCLPLQGLPSGYRRASLCSGCGYFHEGKDFQRDLCEHCQGHLGADRLNHLLVMDTMVTRRRERITCDEEERLKSGYKVTTHFRFTGVPQPTVTASTPEGTKLLELTYANSASLWRINRGLSRRKTKGFALDPGSGDWGEKEGADTEVCLMVEDTTNVLLMKPSGLDPAAQVSFQAALEQAIRIHFKLEEAELDSEWLGQGAYLLFWEAAEGGAGVLSQILQYPETLADLAWVALEICHFGEQPEAGCGKACYRCLLSYHNQPAHPHLDRHTIRAYLEQLTTSQVGADAPSPSRDEQYQWLLRHTDPQSDFEREFLGEVYRQGRKLPDVSQELIPQANLKPDFIYRQSKTAIFCDGAAHDHPERRHQDELSREDLKYTAGYEVLVFRYDEDWRADLPLLDEL